MQQGFIFGGNTGTSYEQLKRRQALANQMAKGSLQTPRNVGEGLSAIGKALAYRSLSKKASAQEAEFSSGLQDAFTGIMGGGFDSSMPAPQGGSMAPVASDPNTRELLAKTLMAEAGGEGEQGMLAAGAVINNRVKSGGYGDSVDGVIMKPGQFSAWNSKTGYAGGQGGLNMDRMRPSESAYKVADMLLSGQYQDPTGGATHYYNPAAANPKWGQRAGGEWTRIGNHIFGSADAGRGGNRQPSRQQASVQNNSGQLSKIAALLSRPEAEMLPAGQRAILTTMLQQGMAANQPMSPLQQQQYQMNQIKMDQMQNDPLAEVKLAQAQLDYEQDRDGTAAPSGAFGNLDAQAQAAGLNPGTPEYQQFMLNGGGDPATFRALHMQAQAAGFTEGTPEYSEFMATRGAGFAAGASQTAKNQANIDTGGAAAEVVAQGAAQGKANVEKGAELAEMERNLPGLLVVADQLDALADTATYTAAGRLKDEARKQTGLEPTEGAIARAKYIAIVDNQVLPLLRQTFGAAFTAKEGETLKNTLGDPDKSPAEKKAVLNAFIEQKKRDLIARGGKVPTTTGDTLPVTFEDFSANPAIQKAASQYGVTVEEMWEIQQEQSR